MRQCECLERPATLLSRTVGCSVRSVSLPSRTVGCSVRSVGLLSRTIGCSVRSVCLLSCTIGCSVRSFSFLSHTAGCSVRSSTILDQLLLAKRCWIIVTAEKHWKQLPVFCYPPVLLSIQYGAPGPSRLGQQIAVRVMPGGRLALSHADWQSHAYGLHCIWKSLAASHYRKSSRHEQSQTQLSFSTDISSCFTLIKAHQNIY